MSYECCFPILTYGKREDVVTCARTHEKRAREMMCTLGAAFKKHERKNHETLSREGRRKGEDVVLIMTPPLKQNVQRSIANGGGGKLNPRVAEKRIQFDDTKLRHDYRYY